MDGSDQLGSAVTLGFVVAVGLVLFFLAAWLARAVWRWMTRGGPKQKDQRQEPKLELAQPTNASSVSASDLFVIRSNLNAVARQVEDLERRLRLSSSEREKVTENPRQ
jgi:flagellar biosynthesis/type III secretory pathway M-ring protein FliF/YscJ